MSDTLSNKFARPGFGVFFRLLKMTLFESEDTAARLTLRRAVVVSTTAALVLLLQVVHRIALALDHVFYPDFRKVVVKEPVFIVGIPRSGTTFCHHLLAEDPATTTFLLWELVFAPSIVERKLWYALGWIDRWLGNRGQRALKAADAWFFAGIRPIHKVSLFEPEEDEIVLMPIFASVFLLLLFPFPKHLRHLTHFDEATPPESKRRIMAFYKGCVQRHLYVHGPEKRFLSKNPVFSSKLKALNETFPDCKVICSVRRPYEAAPSMISLFTYEWEQLDNDQRGYEFRDTLLEIMGHFYRHPIACLPAWPENRHLFVQYGLLTQSPMQTVRDIYARFGFSLIPEYEEQLRTEEEKAARFESRHRYSLEQYDLTPEQIADEFEDVFAYFDFSTDYGN